MYLRRTHFVPAQLHPPQARKVPRLVSWLYCTCHVNHARGPTEKENETPSNRSRWKKYLIEATSALRGAVSIRPPSNCCLPPNHPRPPGPHVRPSNPLPINTTRTIVRGETRARKAVGVNGDRQLPQQKGGINGAEAPQRCSALSLHKIQIKLWYPYCVAPTLEREFVADET